MCLLASAAEHQCLLAEPVTAPIPQLLVLGSKRSLRPGLRLSGCCSSHGADSFPGALQRCFPGGAGHRHGDSDNCLCSCFDPFLYRAGVCWTGDLCVKQSVASLCTSPDERLTPLVERLTYLLPWKALKLCPSNLFSSLSLSLSRARIDSISSQLDFGRLGGQG